MTQKLPIKKPVILAIMDGWGHGDLREHNAVRLAKTPVIDGLDANAPKAFLDASESAVGLPPGQVGNSEVGHLTIGAGRVIEQDLVRINADVESGALAAHRLLDECARLVRPHNGAVHILGMLSQGGVHSHRAHILTLTEAMAERRATQIWLHLFTDGRDALPGNAEKDLAWLQARLPKAARIASICGRYYAMDRDQRWQRTELSFRAIAQAQAEHHFDAPETAIAAAEKRGESDEFFRPAIIGNYAGMKQGDGLIMANFRADRVRQLLALLLNIHKNESAPAPALSATIFMTPYEKTLDAKAKILFPPRPLTDTLGAVVAEAGLRQLRLAETEKYPHITFFLNGGNETPHAGESRCLIPSPHVATYDLQPEMSAEKVLDALINAITAREHELIIVNFANPDMVGHTGDLAAAIKAVETIDTAIGATIKALDAAGGAMLLTADHGNCETMWDASSQAPHTAHTTNPVPLYWLGAPPHARLKSGNLSDLAPSILTLLGLAIPDAMTGASLLNIESP